MLVVFTPQTLAVWSIVIICVGGRVVGGGWQAVDGGRQAADREFVRSVFQCTN